jgi:septal ring factor EnvC (AmiA/AmiB activator)
VSRTPSLSYAQGWIAGLTEKLRQKDEELAAMYIAMEEIRDKISKTSERIRRLSAEHDQETKAPTMRIAGLENVISTHEDLIRTLQRAVEEKPGNHEDLNGHQLLTDIFRALYRMVVDPDIFLYQGLREIPVLENLDGTGRSLDLWPHPFLPGRRRISAILRTFRTS